ncbi:hypothetical protein PS689_00440 [Pseudomonas fluorescens]|nr:hypothetical protein PS689_00440 [Pseudomonas fluorescens]
MSKTLKELSVQVLAKFLDIHGSPVKGQLARPRDLAGETSALRDVIPGERWECYNGSKAFDFLYDDCYCIALKVSLSVEDVESLEEQSGSTIKPVSVPGSIYLYLADKLDLRSKSLEPQWVDQYIVGPAAGEDGVELDVIAHSLENITVFQVNEASVFEQKTSGQYVANYLFTFDSNLKGRNFLSQASLNIIREVFLQEKYRLIESNFFEAMATPLLKHAFLEVYRTLEFVFVLPRANALLDRLRADGGVLDVKVLDFARLCYSELGWKRVERDSISKLFKEYSGHKYSAFIQLYDNCKPFAGVKNPEAADDEKVKSDFVSDAAEKYYQLRNQVAHQFWPDEMKKCDDEDWQALIEFTLGCISYFYSEHLKKIA